MKNRLFAAAFAAAAAATAAHSQAPERPGPDRLDAARFTGDGRMVYPDPELNNAGFATGPVQALEIHYYDSAMFAGGDGFFMFDARDPAPVAALPGPNACTECHDASGGYDSAFVQFYPNMLDVLRERGAAGE